MSEQQEARCKMQDASRKSQEARANKHRKWNCGCLWPASSVLAAKAIGRMRFVAQFEHRRRRRQATQRVAAGRMGVAACKGAREIAIRDQAGLQPVGLGQVVVVVANSCKLAELPHSKSASRGSYPTSAVSLCCCCC